MDLNEILEQLIESVKSGNEDLAKNLANKALNLGIDPVIAIKSLSQAMVEIGEKFSKLEIFLTDMMMSAMAMKAAVNIIKSGIKVERPETKPSKVVIGTVQGDIHDIGKNLVATLLEANGFEVYDLGVDVAPKTFISTANNTNSDIIAASSLLMTSMQYQKEIIDSLNEMNVRDRFKVMVGGGPVTPDWAKKIGADGYGKDAWEAAKIAKELVK